VPQGNVWTIWEITTDGSVVCQYSSGSSNNQKWQLTYVNGYYVLYCLTGLKCLDTGGHTADGDAVEQWGHGTSYNQQWTITSPASGYYKLTNRATGKCLDTGGHTANGNAVEQWASGSSYHQQWTFYENYNCS